MGNGCPLILIAGGTGHLGTALVEGLLRKGARVRVLTRGRSGSPGPSSGSPEVWTGDVRDPATLDAAMMGVTAVVSAIQGLTGTKGCSPKTVDWLGNRNLIRSAQKTRVPRFVLISIAGASSEHQLELFRCKYLAEEYLESSGLDWTIIRPTAFMETWLGMMGSTLQKNRKMVILGRGDNPINFVSIRDVARFALAALAESPRPNRIIEIGGPENLCMVELARRVASISGVPGRIVRVPRTALKAISILARPVNPAFARLARVALVIDSHQMTHAAAEWASLDPPVPLATVDEVARKAFGGDVAGMAR